jgi:hypothetical protein
VAAACVLAQRFLYGPGKFLRYTVMTTALVWAFPQLL